MAVRHFVGSVTVPALRHHVDDLQQFLPHLLRSSLYRKIDAYGIRPLE